MPIIQFSNLNKHGNWRTRRFYSPKSSIGFNPDKFGPSIFVKLFKYDYEGVFPPSLLELNNKTYIVPGWIEVIKGTTLDDINWIKPKEKKQSLVETFKFMSSKGDKEYITRKYTSESGEIKYSCNCFGVVRAPNNCIHIKKIRDLAPQK